MSKKENLTRILLCVSIITLYILCSSWSPGYSINDYPHNIKVAYDKPIIAKSVNIVEDLKDTINTDTTKIGIVDSIKMEVHKYIMNNAPGYSKDMADYLVDKALSNNIDICFIMCQTQIETNFGTTGIGRRSTKKSMFGVKRKYKYTSYEMAIDDYVDVLKKYYLGKGKTEQTLLNKYITHNGARYAANMNYENELKRAYFSIKKRTNIYTLQKRYKTLS